MIQKRMDAIIYSVSVFQRMMRGTVVIADKK